MNSWTLSLH